MLFSFLLPPILYRRSGGLYVLSELSRHPNVCPLLTVDCIVSFFDLFNLCSTIVSKNVGPPFLFLVFEKLIFIYSHRFAKLCCNTRKQVRGIPIRPLTTPTRFPKCQLYCTNSPGLPTYPTSPYHPPIHSFRSRTIGDLSYPRPSAKAFLVSGLVNLPPIITEELGRTANIQTSSPSYVGALAGNSVLCMLPFPDSDRHPSSDRGLPGTDQSLWSRFPGAVTVTVSTQRILINLSLLVHRSLPTRCVCILVGNNLP